MWNETEQQRQERYAELRRRANENLTKVRAGVYRREASVKREEKKTELERAEPWEIQLGHDILERRALHKIFYRLCTKKNMTPEEHGAAEEYQALIDRYDEALEGYTDAECRRFVRLWNKSRKVKYRVV